MLAFMEFVTQYGTPLFGKYGWLSTCITLALITIVYLLVKRLEHKRSRNGEFSPEHNALTAEQTDEEMQNDDDIADISELEHAGFVPYAWTRLSDEDLIEKSEAFYQEMNQRRTVRSFSPIPVPRKAIEMIIKTAGTSPSGAHQQPWTYVVISSTDMKQKIRQIVEKEEEVNYKRRMGIAWVNAIKPFKTDWIKPYIMDAPYIILVFKQLYSLKPNGTKQAHYYSEHSVSISVGMLLAAIQKSGLHSLTSTPLNCGPAINALLKRPSNEKLLYLLPVGFPAEDCQVPNITRKSLEEIAIFI